MKEHRISIALAAAFFIHYSPFRYYLSNLTDNPEWLRTGLKHNETLTK